MFSNALVVITGGSGFIGTNLVLELYHKYGARNIVVIGRRSTPPDIIKDKCRYVSSDLTITPLMEVMPIDVYRYPTYVFHLAGMAGGIHYLMKNSSKVLTTNLKILTNSFGQLESIETIKGQVFLSSVCAYPQEFQTSTEARSSVLSEILTNVHNPDSTYGWSKIMGEMFISNYFKDFGIPGVSIRLFNTYGPYEHFEGDFAHVIPSLISKTIKCTSANSTISVLGDGKQIRSFLYVTDACDAVIKAAITPRVQDGRILNVGSDVVTSVKDIMNILMEINPNVHPMYTEQAPGAKGRIPDITQAKKELGWAPTVELYDGILKTYRWVTNAVS